MTEKIKTISKINGPAPQGPQITLGDEWFKPHRPRRAEIALGGEPAKAAGEVKYKASAVQIRAVGEIRHAAWWA